MSPGIRYCVTGIHEADADAANARRLEPRIDEDYARWKIKA
ncbi:MAG TPA: hypothetical protein VGF77_00430 [Allosphingosinicella sp.]|jgi:hypothetical protein